MNDPITKKFTVCITPKGDYKYKFQGGRIFMGDTYRRLEWILELIETLALAEFENSDLGLNAIMARLKGHKEWSITNATT